MPQKPDKSHQNITSFSCAISNQFLNTIWLQVGSILGTNCVPKSSQGTLLGSKIWHFGLLGPILGLRPPKLVPGPPQGPHFDHIWMTFCTVWSTFAPILGIPVSGSTACSVGRAAYFSRSLLHCMQSPGTVAVRRAAPLDKAKLKQTQKLKLKLKQTHKQTQKQNPS